MTNMLANAISLAVDAHNGVNDKGGFPYILHPMAVMTKLKEDYDEGRFIPEAGVSIEEVLAAAVLHDVVEDTDITVREITERFGPQVGDIVDHVTRREDEQYFPYIERLRGKETAAVIKIMDIFHNLSRMKNLPKGEREFLTQRYKKALSVILERKTG